MNSEYDGTPWHRSVSKVVLGEEQIHIWRISLDVPLHGMADHERLLCAAERERARKFYFERDRRRYVASHIGLRWILGQYIDLPPRQIEFETGEFGKPQLASSSAGQVSFNLSHSGELALLAVAANREIGVDVEIIKPLEDIVRMGRQVFSPSENMALAEAGPDQRAAIFYRYWTRKEAVIKALGLGFSYPTETFTVSASDAEPIGVESMLSGDADSWRLMHLQPELGYVGALAYRGSHLALSRWHFGSDVVF